MRQIARKRFLTKEEAAAYNKQMDEHWFAKQEAKSVLCNQAKAKEKAASGTPGTQTTAASVDTTQDVDMDGDAPGQDGIQQQQVQGQGIRDAAACQDQLPIPSVQTPTSTAAAEAAAAAAAAADAQQEQAGPGPDWKLADYVSRIQPDLSSMKRLGIGGFGIVHRVDAVVDRGNGPEQMQLAMKDIQLSLVWGREHLVWEQGVPVMLQPIAGMENVLAAQLLRDEECPEMLETLRLFMTYPGDGAVSIERLLSSPQLLQLQVPGGGELPQVPSNIFYKQSAQAAPSPLLWPAVGMPYIGVYMLNYAMLRTLNRMHTGPTPAIMRDVSCANLLLHNPEVLFQVVGPLISQMQQQAAAMPQAAAAAAADIAAAAVLVNSSSPYTPKTSSPTAAAAAAAASSAAAAVGPASSAAAGSAADFNGWGPLEFEEELLQLLDQLEVSCCDPESPIRLSGGSFVSVGFQISGARPYAAIDVLRLQRTQQFAEAAAAAAEGPEQDVYSLYRCILRLLLMCSGFEFAPELTATPERTEALLTALCLPPHLHDIMRAGLGLKHKRPTPQDLLDGFAFSSPKFFNPTYVTNVLCAQRGGPSSWEEHLASYLVARPPVLQQRLEVVLGDLGEEDPPGLSEPASKRAKLTQSGSPWAGAGT